MSKKYFVCKHCGNDEFKVEVREEEIAGGEVTNVDYHVCTSCGEEFGPIEYNKIIVTMEVNPWTSEVSRWP